MSDLEYPAGLRYTAEHEWVRADGDTRAGGDHRRSPRRRSATSSTSACPAVGDAVVAGDTCGEVESTKSVSDLYAPVSGEVTAVNGALDATPELVNSDPYGEGWMYELRGLRRGRARRPDGRRGVHRAALLTSLGSDHRKGWANDGAVI